MTLMRSNRWSPFREMWRMMEAMEKNLLPFETDGDWFDNGNLLAVDMSSDEKHVIVKTAIPGVKEDDIHVDVNGDTLNIWAETKSGHEEDTGNWHLREMRYGRFSRTVRLPEHVLGDRADATLENGVLTVKLPKEKPNPVQKIAVKAKKLIGSGNKS